MPTVLLEILYCMLYRNVCHSMAVQQDLLCSEPASKLDCMSPATTCYVLS